LGLAPTVFVCVLLWIELPRALRDPQHPWNRWQG
jgi:hypothetical protein